MFSNRGQDELEPRPIPKPTHFQEITAKPEVPELSVVFELSENNLKPPKNSSNNSNQNTQETYSEWKSRQNRSPILKETRNYEPRDKRYYGSSSYNVYDQNPYSRFSDKISYKSESECHKCACENSPTVKDIYNMMQLQNDQIKFLLETVQKLLVTVVTYQPNQHKCCCFEHEHCKKNDSSKTTKLFQKNETRKECVLENSTELLSHTEKPHTSLNKNENKQKENESNKNSISLIKSNIAPVTQEESKNTRATKCISSDNRDKINNSKEKERTYSVVSDESLDLNASDVHVIEAPISPEQSIHIEMKSSSSEDNSNSEYEEENNKKIEVGWTMYKNIIGQVNNLLEDKSELNSEVVKPRESVKAIPMTKPMNFESYKQFKLPENSQVDSSLQMQALAMQYLSPEQAVKFDMNKHLMPTTQSTTKSPNNYSISTLHYMERYHLIGPDKNLTSENTQQKMSTEGSLKKKKKISRKNKAPSKILNITELKQQPKLS